MSFQNNRGKQPGPSPLGATPALRANTQFSVHRFAPSSKRLLGNYQCLTRLAVGHKSIGNREPACPNQLAGTCEDGPALPLTKGDPPLGQQLLQLAISQAPLKPEGIARSPGADHNGSTEPAPICDSCL